MRQSLAQPRAARVLREPARFQNAADLEHYEQGLTMGRALFVASDVP